MRGFIFVMSALAVMGLAFWAYQENYKTQQALREVRNLHSEIGGMHSRIGVLRAEWAYLNRPDRLRDLADLNFDRLGLLPILPEAFGTIDQVSYPIPAMLAIGNPIEVSSDNAPTDEEPL